MIYWFDGLSDRNLPVTKEWLAVSFDLMKGHLRIRLPKFFFAVPSKTSAGEITCALIEKVKA